MSLVEKSAVLRRVVHDALAVARFQKRIRSGLQRSVKRQLGAVSPSTIVLSQSKIKDEHRKDATSTVLPR